MPAAYRNDELKSAKDAAEERGRIAERKAIYDALATMTDSGFRPYGTKGGVWVNLNDVLAIVGKPKP